MNSCPKKSETVLHDVWNVWNAQPENLKTVYWKFFVCTVSIYVLFSIFQKNSIKSTVRLIEFTEKLNGKKFRVEKSCNSVLGLNLIDCGLKVFTYHILTKIGEPCGI